MEYRTLITENWQQLLVLLFLFICLCTLIYVSIKYFFLKRRTNKLIEKYEKQEGHKLIE